MRKRFGGAVIAGSVGLLIGFMAVTPLQADDEKEKTAVGAWFGIARPCPANPITDSPEHADFCTAVCGACPNAGLVPPEVPMMPTLLADGTVLADDANEIGNSTANNYHTTAHGKWTVSEHDGLPDRRGTQRLKATFFWLGGGTQFFNSVRTRFVTYFDRDDPDRMIGFIQPYFFPFAFAPILGTVTVRPFDPLDPLAGNHIPAMDPLAPLPAGCSPAQGCLGTYHFVIRRIKAQ